MNEITIRFLEVYDYLLSKKIIKGQSNFSKIIGISNSTMTEIVKGRTNAGINPIQNTVSFFPEINSEWLLTGKGDKLLADKNSDLPVLNEPTEDYGLNDSNYVASLIKSLSMKDEIITLYKEKLKTYESKGSTESRLVELEEFSEIIKLKLKLDLEIKNTKKEIVNKKKLP